MSRVHAPWAVSVASFLGTTLLLVSIATTVQANLINDPGFAAATSGTQTSNSNWVLTVNMPDGADPSAEFHDTFAGDPADVGNSLGVWFRSFEGNQQPGDTLANATLSQLIPNVAGGDYVLTFSAKRETGFLASTWFGMLESDGTGGSDQVDLLAAVPNDGAWYTRTLSLTGVSAGDDLTVSIEMIDGEDALTNPQSAFVDNFLLESNVVPEPGTAALLGLGLAALGAIRRNREGSAKRRLRNQ